MRKRARARSLARAHLPSFLAAPSFAAAAACHLIFIADKNEASQTAIRSIHKTCAIFFFSSLMDDALAAAIAAAVVAAHLDARVGRSFE